MSEQDTVERVARAILRAGHPDFTDALIDQRWPGLEGEARAAIEAMREPHNAMIAITEERDDE